VGHNTITFAIPRLTCPSCCTTLKIKANGLLSRRSLIWFASC